MEEQIAFKLAHLLDEIEGSETDEQPKEVIIKF